MELNEAVEMYFEYLRVEKGVSKETILNYAYDLKQFFAVLDKHSTEDLSMHDISEFVRIQTQNRLAVSTILRRISSTKNFYLFLEKERIISFQVEELDKPRSSKRLPVSISFEEVEALLEQPDLEKAEGPEVKLPTTVVS